MRYLVLVALAVLLPANSHSTGRVISPTTYALFHAHYADDGTDTLDLLVLLRGRPGWFMEGNGGRSFSSFGGVERGVVGQHTSYDVQTETVEGKTFTINFNLEAQTAKFLDRDISLTEANVVLVDGADNITPTFVGTRRVDPRLPAGDDPIAATIKQSPELYGFLRCEVQLPDNPAVAPAITQAMRQVLAQLCARMRGR